MHAHTAADPSVCAQFGVFRAIDVASFEIEAVEAQQDSLFAVNVGGHLDRHALIGVILDIGIPKLVPDDEGQWFSGKSGSLRLRHLGFLLFEVFS